MKLIDADALLKKTINNPLHVPYITKKDVIDMPSALNNQVNLCDSCTYTYPECPSEKDDVIFGNGIGNDNICACNKYQPTVQPVATDTNVGDAISRQGAIDALDVSAEYLRRVLDLTDIAGVDRENCEWVIGLIEAQISDIKELLSAQPEPKEGHWIKHETPDGGEQYECSRCGVLWEFNDGTPEDNEAFYCPKCGVKMKGEQDGH